MDLADELLADLNEGGDDAGSGPEEAQDEEAAYAQQQKQQPEAGPSAGSSSAAAASGVMAEDEPEDDQGQQGIAVPEGGTKPAEELDSEQVQDLNLKAVADVKNVAKLASSKAFQDCVKQVQEYRNKPPTDISGSESPEYKLIVQANNYAVEIDNDILMVHKFAKDHYATRFAELEQFATGPLDFCRAVQRIGNPEDLTGLQERLQGVLPNATLMVIAVAATDNTGKQLSEAGWAAVRAACDMCFELDQSKADILTYVESRMNRLAPNLSAIIGPRTATKLLGVAGGLQALARQPSCNIHLFGAQKKQAALGLSTGPYAANRKHVGFIYQSDLVQGVPEEYRGKAQRTVSAKCALAIRMDANRSHQDGDFGFSALEDLQKKLDKLSEPPPKKVTKALPKPNEGPSKKRGGKRARKEKEAYAMTELRKLQNRVKFGEEELEDGAFDETKGLGMIGTSSTRLRASMGEDRSKAKLSKAHKNRLSALKGGTSTAGGGGSDSGMASSLAFTPVQGMELVDPAAKKRKLEAANNSWFKNEGSSAGTFSVLPGKK